MTDREGQAGTARRIGAGMAAAAMPEVDGPASPDPGLAGTPARPVPGIDNGFAAGYRVRFDEAGADGLLRTSTLLRYAQDIAWRHSEDRGFDRSWYAERGRWWVVRSVDLDVLAPVPMGRTLRLATAVVGHRRIWARRRGEFRLPDGTLAAVVTTDWVIVEERGRVIRIPPDFGEAFPNPELDGEIIRVAPPVAPPSAARLAIRVRPQDLDPMGHVNNAVYLTYCEMARIRYWSDVTGEPVAAGHEGAESLILAEARITYRAPVFHTETVTVETRATHIGRSSFTLEHRLTSCAPGGWPRLVAVSDSVMVRYDYRTDRPAPLSDAFVDAIEAFEGRSLR